MIKLTQAFAWLTVVFAVMAAIAIATGHAQSMPDTDGQCAWTVSDGAGIFGSNPDSVVDVTAPLVNEGADVKVVTIEHISDYGSGLAAVESAFESKCTSWRAPNGQRKANLFVLMIAPNDRKKNVFFGSAYRSMLPDEDTVNVIYSHAANPYFAQKQWAQGVGAAVKDFADKVVAYHDQRMHPVSAVSTSTTHVDAVDLSGFWEFLMWALLAMIGAAGLIMAGVTLKERRRRADELAAAKSRAMHEWNLTNTSFLSMADDNPRKIAIAQQFKDLTESGCYPDRNMSKAEYESAAVAWRELRVQIAGGNVGVGQQQAQRFDGETLAQSQAKYHQRRTSRSNLQPQTQSQPSTVIVNNTGGNGNDMLTGVLIGESIAGSRMPYVPPTPKPEPEPDPTPSYSGDSDSSGSDSSWSSSDSGSSGGSDSSWSSSDSGGGGGSDSGW